MCLQGRGGPSDNASADGSLPSVVLTRSTYAAARIPLSPDPAHLFMKRGRPLPRMAEVTITYCLPCRYQFKAVQDADAILTEFGTKLEGLRLVPGEHGVYDVAVNGRIVFSLDKEERFPESPDLIARIRAALM